MLNRDRTVNESQMVAENPLGPLRDVELFSGIRSQSVIAHIMKKGACMLKHVAKEKQK